MKRTLFNTMMGCLSALSLAGCGGSGSSSSGPSASSGPSESLISEGFDGVYFWENPNTTNRYMLALRANQTCVLWLNEGSPNCHKVTGTWSAKSLGNGEFELSLSIGDTSDNGCTIRGVSSVRLTIDNNNMEEYRNGDVTDATISVVPFTHSGTCGYDDTVFDGGGLIRQYDVNE